MNLSRTAKWHCVPIKATFLGSLLASIATAQTVPGNAVDIPAGADGVTINNGVGGQITANTTAIRTEAQVSITNAGTIAGAVNAIDFVNGLGSGSVVNAATGSIQSDSRAINIGGQVLIDNSGAIIGSGDQRNGTVYSDSTANNFTINNAVGGRIDAGAGNSGAGFSAELSPTGTNFSINNAGTIAGRGNAGAGAATAGDGIRLERSRVAGELDGSTVGTFTGSIINSGTISSEGANGTVGGFRAVNGVSFQGELNNTGTIQGVQNGVYFGNPTPAGGGDHTGGIVNNSGTISSDSRALNIDGTGLTINNLGNILGTGDQRNGTVYADSTAQDFTLNNRGVIDAGAGNSGAGFSVELDSAGNDFTINNTGTIAGRGTADAGLATAGDGIRLERSRVSGSLDGSTTGLFTGVINNSGTVTSEGNSGTTAGFRAVNGVSFQGALNNTGEISGVQNGVYFGNSVPAGGADHTGGVVNNSGLISSDSRAVNVDGQGLTINNSGQIAATGQQRNGTLYVDATANDFTINNLAGGTIDATGGTGSGVSVQVGPTATSVQSGSIRNAGMIIGSGSDAANAGIRLFTATPGAIFQGDIFNEFGGVISSENGSAILIQSGVTFDGTLFNAGTIDGGASLASGDVVLEDTSRLVLSFSDYTAGTFETFDVAGNIDFGGTLELDFGQTAPIVGNVLDLFSFAGATGSFDQIIAEGFTVDSSELLSLGRLSITGVTAVPEPSSIAALVAIGLLAVRHRRRKLSS